MRRTLELLRHTLELLRKRILAIDCWSGGHYRVCLNGIAGRWSVERIVRDSACGRTRVRKQELLVMLGIVSSG